jgi:hypothetical protein
MAHTIANARRVREDARGSSRISGEAEPHGGGAVFVGRNAFGVLFA